MGTGLFRPLAPHAFPARIVLVVGPHQLRRQVVQRRLAHNPLRLKSYFPSNIKLIWAVQRGANIFRFTIPKIRIITSAVSHPHEGRIAIVTTRWARDVMDAAFQRRMVLLRTAKSCGPGAAMLALSLAGSFPRGDGDNKPAPPRRARSKP
jgi:hypothetical protein